MIFFGQRFGKTQRVTRWSDVFWRYPHFVSERAVVNDEIGIVWQ